jgi:TonB dependent receptor/Gram-negative bacterial TonB protein C-terminal
MLTFLRAAGLCLAVVLACASARAQPAPPALTPPVVQSSTDVPYPEGAEGDAAVVLELVIESDGSVSSATVVDGLEPFAEQARVAALAWRFLPAQRGDTQVAARIPARVDFHREQEPDVAPAPTTASAPPVAPEPGPSVEVTVVGNRREIGQTTLSKSDVREMPGAFGDAFRAIEALPGVAPVVSGVPYFYVRGAPPNNAGYFVDGIRVPLLFHLGLGQSVLHPGLVDHVDFFPSAPPASYGGYVGSIIAGRIREPAHELRGEANVRLVDAGALVETPFANGRGSALVAGRYGYPGPILALATDDLKLGYWDYQARTSWKLGSRDTIGLFAFGSHDYLASRSRSGDPAASRALQEQFVSDFHRLDLRYDHALSEGRLRLALTGGYDSQGAQPTYVKNRSVGARLEIEQKFTESLRFRGGADAQLDHYGLRITAQGPREPVVPVSADPPPTNLRVGLHADFVWRVSPSVELVPGARFDLYGSSRQQEAPSRGHAHTLRQAVDPRISARVRVSSQAVWLSTFGISHQYPSLRLGDVPGPILSVPGFPFDDERHLQGAMQGSQGFEVALPADLVLTATGFYSHFWGLTDLSASCFQDLPPNTPPPMPNDPVPPYVCANNQPVRGRAYGLELLLRRPFTKRLSGWLSYTLSRSTRQAHFITPEGADALANVASEFDRTHVLNAILGYDFGRGWRVGSRLLFYTGTPYSKLAGSYPVPPYSAYRNPAFYRLDFRLEKRWRLTETGSIAFVLEGQNVTLRKEVTGLGLECEGEGFGSSATNTCEQSKIGPLTIPSVGVEAFF